MLRLMLTGAVLLSLFTLLAGQSPAELSFQGFLNDHSGNPVDGSYNLTFKLYRGGAEIWTETQKVDINKGIFSVALGTNSRLDTLSFNIPLELGIKVGTDPELSPRAELISAAYARALPGLYTFYRGDPSAFESYNVIGGAANNVVGPDVTGATIGGGGGMWSGIGRANEVHGNMATVGGGSNNQANEDHATVAGGSRNLANAEFGAVGGGDANWVTGKYATIPGGWFNEAAGDRSFAAGHKAKALHRGTFVWADDGSTDFASTGLNQFLIRASGGVGIGTTHPSGNLHVSGGAGAAILVLEADTNNVSEFNNPRIILKQDGGTIGATVGFWESGFGSNNFGIGRRYADTYYFDTFVMQAVDGDIGIGTTDPGSNRLSVVSNRTGGIPGATLDAENLSTGSGIAAHFETNGTDATLVIDQDGTGPHIKTFDNGVLRFQVSDAGNVTASGTITGGGADLAEMVRIDGEPTLYEPGDVLVVSPNSNRSVTVSSSPYSTSVVGVYATKPGMLLKDHVFEGMNDSNVPLAVVGIVPTKVSAENGAIARGDLLVTSSIPGHAMKGKPVLVDGIEIYPSGTILGKALEPFGGTGTGMIEVLVNTQ